MERLTSLPAIQSAEPDVSLIPLPVSTLFDDALVNDCGCDAEDDAPAVIRINTHNLILRESRLVDLIYRIA